MWGLLSGERVSLGIGWDGKTPLMKRIHQAVLLPDLRLEGKLNLRQGVKEALNWV